MTPSYEKSVFINCPYDSSFEPLFHAIVLTVAARGFTPRCARESEGQADPRIDRIASGLMKSKYSIHDLSRYHGEGPDNLSRFNMPVELGIAIGLRYQKARAHSNEESAEEHNWVALVPPNFAHHQYLSNLAGYELPHHDQTPFEVIKKVASWLSIQPDFVPSSFSANMIFAAYPAFRRLLDQSKEQEMGSLTWPSIIRNAELILTTVGSPEP